MNQPKSREKILSFCDIEKGKAGKMRNDATQGPAAENNTAAQNDAPEDVFVGPENARLPPPLQAYRFQMYLIAVFSILVCIGLLVVFQELWACTLLLGSGFFAFQGWSVARRYKTGQIREVPVLCTSVQASKFRDRVVLTFRTEPDDPDEEQEFFRFSNRTKKTIAAFAAGRAYIIYFDITSAHNLLAYQEL